MPGIGSQTPTVNRLKCTIVSFQSVADLPSLQCGGRKWNKDRRDVEYAFLPTVRIWNGLWYVEYIWKYYQIDWVRLQQSHSTSLISPFYIVSLARIWTPHFCRRHIYLLCPCKLCLQWLVIRYFNHLHKSKLHKKLDERKGKYVFPYITLLPIKSNKLVLIIRNFLFLLLFLDLFIGTICQQFASISCY